MSDKGMMSSDDIEEESLYKETLKTGKINIHIRIEREVQRREVKIRHGSHSK